MIFGRAGADSQIEIVGLPTRVLEEEKVVFNAKLDEAARTLLKRSGLKELDVHIRAGHAMANVPVHSKTPGSRRQHQPRRRFAATPPCSNGDDVVLPNDVQDQLKRVFSMVRHRDTLVNRGFLSTPLVNFVGPSGVGKTRTAHWVSARLGKPIISVAYPDLESMYVGVGPKKVEALFRDAVEQDATVFIDEGDAAVSERVLAKHGSERADNSIKVKLLTLIGQHPGLLMLATNRFEDYDRAFVSRIMVTVHFPVPDETCRERLWKLNLQKTPLAADVNASELARLTVDLVGRDIEHAAYLANTISLGGARAYVCRQDLIAAIEVVRLSHRRCSDSGISKSVSATSSSPSPCVPGRPV